MNSPKQDKTLANAQAAELAAEQAKNEALQAEKNAKVRALMSRNSGRTSLFSGSELGVASNSNTNSTLG